MHRRRRMYGRLHGRLHASRRWGSIGEHRRLTTHRACAAATRGGNLWRLTARPATPSRRGALHTLEHVLDRQRAIEEREAYEQRLEQELLLPTATEMGLQLDQDREHPEQIRRLVPRLPRGQLAGEILRELRHGAAQDDGELRAQQVGEAGKQQPEIGTKIRQAGNRAEHVTGAMLGDQVEQGQILVLVHQPERVTHPLRGHSSAQREHLVRQRECVTHRAIGRAGEHAKRIGVGGDPLGFQHHGEPLAHIGRADPLEVESLHAREHWRGGLRDLLRLGCGKHEHHARRRLLQHLEQRIPRLTREHVRFVDDVDLVVLVAARRVGGAAAQVARVIDATVRRGVDFHDVDRGMATPNPCAGLARAAGFAIGRSLFAIERHRQNAGERGLAGAARTAEQVRVRYAIAANGIAERRRHVRLHRHIGESARPVLASEGERHSCNLLHAVPRGQCRPKRSAGGSRSSRDTPRASAPGLTKRGKTPRTVATFRSWRSWRACNLRGLKHPKDSPRFPPTVAGPSSSCPASRAPVSLPHGRRPQRRSPGRRRSSAPTG